MQTYQGEVCHSTTPPSRNGVATPRRIVRSLRAPPSCVTALVKLDSGTNDNGTVLNGTLNGRRLPHYPLGDFSEDTEDVGSEICSIADDQDISITSIPTLGAKKTPSAGVMYSGPRGGRFHQRTGSNQIPRRFASCPRSGNANSHNLMSSSGASAEVDLYTDLALSVQSSSFSFHSHDPAMIEVPLRSPNTPINDSFDSANMLESVPSCSLTVLGQSDAANSFPASNTGGGACAQAIARRSAGIRGDHGITESGSSRSQCGVAARHDSKTIEAANAMTLLLAKQSTSDSAGDPRDADEVTLPPPSRQRESLKTVPSIIPPAPPAPLPCLKFADDPIEDESGPVWRVQRAKKLERIGRGSYGDVYRGLDLDTNKVIAIKEIVISKDFTKDMEKQIQALEREVKVMRKLNHKNTVRYLGAARDEVGLSIFMEYIAGGSIGTYLAEKQALSEAETRSYTSQLLCGLEYLHARHILHRDLKGDNLFLTEDNVLKLGDFGTSKELVTTVVTDSIAGTPNFMAPEIIACSGHSYEADIWSVGCCVLEMLTGKPPFRNMDNHMAIMFAVMKGKIEEQVPAHISSGAKNFIKMCTMPSPKDRWTATQLRHHYWLLGEEDPAGSSVGAVPDGAALPSLVPTTSTSSLSKKQVPAQLDTAALENKAMVVSPDNSSKTGGISNSNPSSMEESPCKITPKCTPEMPKVKDAPSRSRSRKTSDEGVKGESRSKHSKGSKSSKHRNSDDASRAGQSNTTPSLSPARPSAGTSSTTDAQHTPSPPSGKGSHSHHSHHSHHRGKDASGTEKLATNSMASTARLPPGDKPCTFPQPATPPSGANKVAPTEERGRRRPRGIPSQSRGSKPKANLQVAS